MKHSFHVLLAAISIVLSLCTVGRADVVRVKADAAGANNGTSWADAFTDLQAALASSKAGDEIWVAAGTYKPTTGSDRTISFVMKEGVAIYGGFAGGETAREQRDWTAHVTTLHGNIGDVTQVTDNSYRLVVGADNAILDGFTVTGARGENGGLNQGGGMYNNEASPTVTNCTFDINSSIYGGGMYNDYGSPTISHCTFSRNWGYQGGGMFNSYEGTPTVTDCIFRDNSGGISGVGMYNNRSNSTVIRCTFSNNAGGGMFNQISSSVIIDCIFSNNPNRGICCYQGSPTITGCTFTGNRINGEGGAMWSYQGSPTVSDCLFSGNSGRGGGGLATERATPTVTGCTFIDNTASASGGGLYLYSGSATVTRCTFSGNSAQVNGGGLSGYNNGLTAVNCLFTGNSAEGNGGAINSSNGSSTLTHCTLNGNTANRGGGLSDDGAAITLTSCIFWSDSATTRPEIYFSQAQSVPTLRSCDVAGCGGSGAGWAEALGVDGGGNLDEDPSFANPDLPSGVDRVWMTYDDGLALFGSSPCVDAGLADGAPATDIVGDPRDGLPDIGAYEGERKNATRAWALYQ